MNVQINKILPDLSILHIRSKVRIAFRVNETCSLRYMAEIGFFKKEDEAFNGPFFVKGNSIFISVFFSLPMKSIKIGQCKRDSFYYFPYYAQ